MTGGLKGIVRCGAIGALALSASPAMAATGFAIPEPTDVTLFALAMAGLIYGRRNGKRPPEDEG